MFWPYNCGRVKVMRKWWSKLWGRLLHLQGDLRHGPTLPGTRTVWFSWREWNSNDRWADGAASSMPGMGTRHGRKFSAGKLQTWKMQPFPGLEQDPRPRARTELNLFQASIGGAMGWLRCATELYVWCLFFLLHLRCSRKSVLIFLSRIPESKLTCKLHSIITSLTASLASLASLATSSAVLAVLDHNDSTWFNNVRFELAGVHFASGAFMREEKRTAVEGCFLQIKQEIRTFIHSIFKWNILNIAEAEASAFLDHRSCCRDGTMQTTQTFKRIQSTFNVNTPFVLSVLDWKSIQILRQSQVPVLPSDLCWKSQRWSWLKL